MSVAIAERTNLIAAATSIKGILDGANGGNNPVVCIKLLGEQANNLNDELGVAYDGTTFAVTHKAPSDALKQNYVSGVISYETDGNRGATVFQSIRSITEKATEDFAAQLGTVPADCRLNVLDVLSCPNGRRNPRDHRRFNLFFATRVDPADAAETAQTETIELPVAGAGALDILACANAAAALTGLYCIGYTGENYDRFHKLLV